MRKYRVDKKFSLDDSGFPCWMHFVEYEDEDNWYIVEEGINCFYTEAEAYRRKRTLEAADQMEVEQVLADRRSNMRRLRDDL